MRRTCSCIEASVLRRCQKRFRLPRARSSLLLRRPRRQVCARLSASSWSVMKRGNNSTKRAASICLCQCGAPEGSMSRRSERCLLRRTSKSTLCLVPSTESRSCQRVLEARKDGRPFLQTMCGARSGSSMTCSSFSKAVALAVRFLVIACLSRQFEPAAEDSNLVFF